MRYSYRLRPGVCAERALVAEWHRCRFLWNEAVHRQKSSQISTFARLGKLLTEVRARNLWLREGSQVAQQQMLRTYAQTLDRSRKLRGRGRPVFKSRRKCLPSLEYTTRGFSICGGRLNLPKGVSVPVVWSRALPSSPHRYESIETLWATGMQRSLCGVRSPQHLPPLLESVWTGG